MDGYDDGRKCQYCGNMIDPLQLCGCPNAVADWVARRTSMPHVVAALRSAAGEIAKLREELEEAKSQLSHAGQAMLNWKQRAELAEAKIREAEEQEPVGYRTEEFAGHGCTWDGSKSVYPAALTVPVPVGTKLYVRPIPPADVAELQKRIAELERKLAEQQAALHYEIQEHKECLRSVSGVNDTSLRYETIAVIVDASIAERVAISTEELNALLAKARAEAVPEWIELCRRLYVELYHCDKQMTLTLDEEGSPLWTTGKTVSDVLSDARAMLATAPKPGEEK